MPERKTYFAEVLLPLPVQSSFTYRLPLELNESVKIGMRVVVPFGKKKLLSGIVLSLTETVPSLPDVKYVIGVLDDVPVVNNLQLGLWRWISDYYICHLGEVMQAALPSALKLSSESKISLHGDFVPDIDMLSDSEYLVTEALMVKETITVNDVAKIVGYKKVMPLINSMIDKHLIVMVEELTPKFKARLENFVRLSDTYNNETAMQELMNSLSKRAYKQLELLLAFFALHGSVDVEVRVPDLLKKAGTAQSVLKTMLDKGIFVSLQKRVRRLKDADASSEVSSISLTPLQQKAFDEIHQGFNDDKPVLLHGVTSSGKTEIYIKIIDECLRQGRQVLYLLPEIALTEHIINRLKKYFGNKVGVYHSRYNENERVEIWHQVLDFESKHDSKYQIVIGSRSAVFLPFSNIGVVIVDEEHDSSFKQTDPAPRYSARDLAIVLAKFHHAKVLLGSATPSFESYYNAMIDKYRLVSLLQRYGGIEMPEILVDDMREEKRRKTVMASFGSMLVSAMQDAVAKDKQVILFRNRRGFSPRVECTVCGYVPQCVNCDVSLTYHKQQNIMKCHYCGYVMDVPAVCPSCHSSNFVMKGLGTEKIEEDLSSVLPDISVARLDLDTTRSKNGSHNILEKFRDNETKVLVGTQMVTKGLDFDNVKLVGVIDADSMLSYPDFRAFERAFQLMEQVCGRAGRKGDRGKMIIQTYQPTHPVILDLLNHDFISFFMKQMPVRKQFNYPPFSRLVLLKLKYHKMDVLNNASDILAERMRHISGCEVIGPEYPVVPRIKNMFIKQLLIKIERNANLLQIKESIKQAVREIAEDPSGKLKSVNIVVDVDPA